MKLLNKMFLLFSIMVLVVSCGNENGNAKIPSDILMGYGTIYKNDKEYLKGNFEYFNSTSSNDFSFSSYGFIDMYYPLSAIEILTADGKDVEIIDSNVDINSLSNILVFVNIFYSDTNHEGKLPSSEDTSSEVWIHRVIILDESYRKAYFNVESISNDSYKDYINAYFNE